MRKHDNDWEISDESWHEEDKELHKDCFRYVTINKESYCMPEELAGITHAILLLVDAINDYGKDE